MESWNKDFSLLGALGFLPAGRGLPVKAGATVKAAVIPAGLRATVHSQSPPRKSFLRNTGAAGHQATQKTAPPGSTERSPAPDGKNYVS